MGATGAVGGWFEPADDLSRAWDEAEAVLVACEDLDSVMETIRDAESPVEARRALKANFGFTGRQAALLLTLPVLSFTRSERARMDEGRRARMELLADITGAIPVVPENAVEEPSARVETPPTPGAEAPLTRGAEAPLIPGPPSPVTSVWGAEFDGTMDRIRSVIDEYSATDDRYAGSHHADDQDADDHHADGHYGADDHYGVAPVGFMDTRVRRMDTRAVEEASVVLDEQIAELCDAIAELIDVEYPIAARLDDPRESGSPTGQLLDGCGVDDATGIRTLLWHLRRTGLESLDGLLPFAEPLPGSRGFDAQSAQFDVAVSSGLLASEPGGGTTWAGRLWPIAERRGFGYAVLFGSGPDAGSVWAYGGGEPLHRLWDSVVDMLVELYQALTLGRPCDSALAAVIDGRVVWSNLS